MSKMRPGRAFTLLSVAALACALAACTEDTPCDEGQELQQGACYPAADAAVPIGSDASTGEEAGTASPFDRTCATNADCIAPANHCAVPPGKCTATGCVADPSVCPPSWTCLDLTAMGQPDVCIPPNL